MREAHIRDIKFFDCRVESTPVEAAVPSLRKILAEFQKRFTDNQYTWWSRSKDTKVFVRDMELVNNDFRLLLYSNQGNAPAASFAHLQTNEQRDEAALDGEGRPESAHVIIRCADDNVGRNVYLMLCEEAKTLPRSRIQQYLNYVLRKIKKVNPGDWRYRTPDGAVDEKGRPVTKPFSSNIIMAGHLSSEFREAIANGKLSGVFLETYKQELMGFGDGQLVRPVAHQVKLKPVFDWRHRPLESISEALVLARAQKWEQVRIVFRTADGTSHTDVLDAMSGQSLTDGFVKTVRISHTAEKLPEAATGLNRRFCEQMIALI